MVIDLIVGIFIVALFFLFGFINESIKKLIKVLTNAFCKLLELLRIPIAKEKLLFVSDEFTELTGTKLVIRSDIGMKRKRLFNILYLIIAIVMLTLISVNLSYVGKLFTGAECNLISDWLKANVNIPLITDKMDTFFTATTFTILSFSLTSLLKSWNESRDVRRERRIQRQNSKVIKRMTGEQLTKLALEKNKEEQNNISKGDKK